MSQGQDPVDRAFEHAVGHDADRPARQSWQRRAFRQIGRAAYHLVDGDSSTGRWTKRGLLAIGAGIVLYYLVGAMIVHVIDDDLTYADYQRTAGGSRAVDMAAALIIREIDINGWTANAPFFEPGVILDNKPNFQQGIIYAIGRFTLEMSDQIGRTRGSSQVDADLDRAVGLLRYPGDRWHFDLTSSIAPTPTSESQYRSAAQALLGYNRRLAAGEATFDQRADNLLGTLNRIAADLGSGSAVIADHVATGRSRLIDLEADDVFYQTKGRLYGYTMIIKELGADFESIIAERGMQPVWDQLIESLETASRLQPLVVLNGAPDGQLAPSHLAAQGFYLLRARTRLREVTDILRN